MTTTDREPLKAVAVEPPSLAQVDSEGLYTVTVRLSRPVTPQEAGHISNLKLNMRAYNRQLDIARSTVENVAQRRDEIVEIIRGADAAGRDYDERMQRARQERERLSREKATEEERLRNIAEGIKFE